MRTHGFSDNPSRDLGVLLLRLPAFIAFVLLLALLILGGRVPAALHCSITGTKTQLVSASADAVLGLAPAHRWLTTGVSPPAKA